jgi:PAS domain S-box-containing protein
MKKINNNIILKAINWVRDNIIITDVNGIILWCNDSTFHQMGYSEEELLGKKSNVFRHPETSPDIYSKMWDDIKNKKIQWNGKIKNLKKDGATCIHELTINQVLNKKNEIEFFVCIQRDITEAENMKMEIKNKIRKAQDLVSKQLKNHKKK